MGTCSSSPLETKRFPPEKNPEVEAVAVAVVSCYRLDEQKREASNEFYSQLMGISGGKSIILQATANSLLAANNGQRFESGLLGTSFGATMDQVIASWGPPNNIWMQGHQDDVVELTFYHSAMIFRRNRLETISVHSVDFKGTELVPGLIFGKSVPKLAMLFPNSVPTSINQGPQVLEIETGSGVKVRCQSHISGKLIALTVSVGH